MTLVEFLTLPWTYYYELLSICGVLTLIHIMLEYRKGNTLYMGDIVVIVFLNATPYIQVYFVFASTLMLISHLALSDFVVIRGRR